MSDACKMNLAISRYLKQILAGHVQESHIYALAMLMTGLIRSKSANGGVANLYNRTDRRSKTFTDIFGICNPLL